MLVLPALPLVVVSGAPVGVALVEEDELDEGLVLAGVELSAGGMLEEPELIEELSVVEPDGVMLLVELVELGVEVELLDVELGVLGVTSVVDEVVEDVEGVAVELLLRSQPVTAAVATASTATRGMSLFMTSPFRNGLWCRTIPHGAGWALRSTSMHNAQAVPAPFPRKQQG